MVIIHGIIIFDTASICTMLVIASLSKSMGEALKIAPYYKLLYLSVMLITLAAIGDTLPYGIHVSLSKILTPALRCAAGMIALPVCLRYWKWLISEYFKS
jgi:hypothetical protein